MLYACTEMEEVPTKTERYGMLTFTKKSDNCVIANGVARPPGGLLEQLCESMRPTRRGQILPLVSVRVLPVIAPASGPWEKRTALKCVRP